MKLIIPRRHAWLGGLKRMLRDTSRADDVTDNLHLPADLVKILAERIPVKSIADTDEKANNILQLVTFRVLTRGLCCLIDQIDKNNNQPISTLRSIQDLWINDSHQYNLLIHDLLVNTANSYHNKISSRMLMSAAQLIKMTYRLSDNAPIIDNVVLDYLTELAIVLCYFEAKIGRSKTQVIIHEIVDEIAALPE